MSHLIQVYYSMNGIVKSFIISEKITCFFKDITKDQIFFVNNTTRCDDYYLIRI